MQWPFVNERAGNTPTEFSETLREGLFCAQISYAPHHWYRATRTGDLSLCASQAYDFQAQTAPSASEWSHVSRDSQVVTQSYV